MSESWKEPEEDNMSIGELIDYLRALPKNCSHLPVKLVWQCAVFPVNPGRLHFTDGEKYYSEGLLKNRATFDGIYLEIDGDYI